MISWSYSHYSTAVQCLRKYKLAVLENKPAGETSSDMAFGTSVHAGLHASLKDESGEMAFQATWESYKDAPLEYGRYKWEALLNLGLSFIDKFNRLHRKKYTPQLMEELLQSEYKGIKVHGTPDYYGDYEGKRALVDFKTSSTLYPQERKLMALQLYLYAYLHMSVHKHIPELLGYVVFQKSNGSIQVMMWEFNENTMYQMLDEWADYVRLFQSQTTFPKNVNSCLAWSRPCEYLNICNKEESV